MSWDSMTENVGYYLEVASSRMARRALKANIKSLTKMAEDDTIGEWLPFLDNKSLTKSLKRDVQTILAKITAEKAVTTSKQKDKSKIYPEDL